MPADFKITKLSRSTQREAAMIKNAQRHVFEAEIPAQSAFLTKMANAARRARAIERHTKRDLDHENEMDGWN